MLQAWRVRPHPIAKPLWTIYRYPQRRAAAAVGIARDDVQELGVQLEAPEAVNPQSGSRNGSGSSNAPDGPSSSDTASPTIRKHTIALKIKKYGAMPNRRQQLEEMRLHFFKRRRLIPKEDAGAHKGRVVRKTETGPLIHKHGIDTPVRKFRSVPNPTTHERKQLKLRAASTPIQHKIRKVNSDPTRESVKGGNVASEILSRRLPEPVWRPGRDRRGDRQQHRDEELVRKHITRKIPHMPHSNRPISVKEPVSTPATKSKKDKALKSARRAASTKKSGSTPTPSATDIARQSQKVTLLERCAQIRATILQKAIGVEGRYKVATIKSLDALVGEITRNIQQHENAFIIRSLVTIMNGLVGRTNRVVASREPKGGTGRMLQDLGTARSRLRQQFTRTLRLLQVLGSEQSLSIDYFRATGTKDLSFHERHELMRESFRYLHQLLDFWGKPRELAELSNFLEYRRDRERRLKDPLRDFDPSVFLDIVNSMGTSNDDFAELPHEEKERAPAIAPPSRQEIEALIEQRIRKMLPAWNVSNSASEPLVELDPEDKEDQFNSAPKTPEVKRPWDNSALDPNQSLYEELFPNDDSQKPELLYEHDENIPRLPLPKTPPAPTPLSTMQPPTDLFPAQRPKPALDPDQATILILYNGSPSLSLQDFTSILPPQPVNSKSWSTLTTPSAFAPSFVLPMRDDKTLERSRNHHYYLVFPSHLAARTYRDRAYRLYTLAKTHTPNSIESVMGPARGQEVSGEDLHRAVKGFTLVPPSQNLALHVLQKPYTSRVKNLIVSGGYAQVVGEGGGGGANVLMEFYGGVQPSRQEIDEAIGMDIRARGLAWRIERVDGAVARRVEGGRFEFDGERDGEQVWGGEKEAKERKEKGNPKWIVSFEDLTEARRFARAWHQRRMLWKKETLHKGLEDKTMVRTEVLW